MASLPELLNAAERAQLSALWQQLSHNRQRALWTLQAETCATVPGTLSERLTALVNSWLSARPAQHAKQGLLLAQTKQLEHCISHSQLTLNQLWPEHRHQVLGQNLDLVIFDGRDGLEPNLLAAVAGTVNAGGLLVIIVPNANNDPLAARFQVHETTITHASAQHFLTRCQQLLPALSHGVWSTTGRIECQPHVIAQAAANNVAAALNSAASPAQQPAPQQQWINTTTANLIHHPATTQPVRAVLLAERGRGKSSALGLLAQRLATQHSWSMSTIAVTASNPANVLSCQQFAPQLRFLPPDQLTNEQLASLRLLLVDEAASLPVPLLKQWSLSRCNIIFASTQHGYEGSGRGFTLKFLPWLAATFTEVATEQLLAPMRYQLPDAIESAMAKVLLLDSQAEPATSLTRDTLSQTDTITIDCLSSADLASNEPRLRAVFQLLVNAHYQTSANDLKHFLDGNNWQFFVGYQQQQLIAAAAVSLEGQFPATLANDICAGRRRPRGHLLSQQLCQFYQLPELASHRSARITRIAVQPHWQRLGIGRQLLSAIRTWADSMQCDWLGSAFGIDEQVSRFWLDQQFTPLRIGFTQDHASGERALLVAKPLSQQARQHWPALCRYSQLAFTQWQAQLTLPWLANCINTLKAAAEPLAMSDDRATCQRIAVGYYQGGSDAFSAGAALLALCNSEQQRQQLTELLLRQNKATRNNVGQLLDLMVINAEPR